MGVGKTSGNTGGVSNHSSSNSNKTTGTTTKTAEKVSYTVKSGDTLSQVSAKLGKSLSSVKASNPQIKDYNKIHPGDKINVPGASAIKNATTVAGVKAHTVKKGETLSQIAQKYKITVGNLLRANPKAVNPRDLIYPGQKLNLPSSVQGLNPTEKTNPTAPVKNVDTSKLDNKAVTTKLPSKGPGYASYYTDARKYGTAKTVQSLKNIASSWNAKHPNSPIQFGDMSKKGGGKISGHASHQKGVDVDIRPFRKDGKQGPVTIHDKNYDKAKTKEMVKTIKEKYPNTTIYFNDRDLIKQGLTKAWPHHDNHLHLRFH